jgi:hypothetical protein
VRRLALSKTISESFDVVLEFISSFCDGAGVKSCGVAGWVTSAASQSVFPGVEVAPVGFGDSNDPVARWDAIEVPAAVDGPEVGSITTN